MKLDQTKLQSIIDEALAFFDTCASISLSVWDGQDVVSAAGGLSNADTGVPATVNTKYAIGSSTKAFTGAAIGILADQGKLELDQPVRNYLPEFKMYDPYATEHLTVRDILCHRCGLPRHDVSWILQPELTHRELVPLLEFLPPAYPFRYRFHYNNFMFMLGSVLVERISGQSYEDFVHQHILEPLGMRDTYVYADMIPDEDPQKSVPHSGKDHVFKVLPRDSLRNAAGAGAIYSTTPDMIKWLRFRLHGDEKILSHKMRLEAQSPQMLIRDGEMAPWSFPEITSSTYGFGWFVETYRGVVIIHHGGTVGGYRSMQLFVPDKDIAVSALTNSNAADAIDSLTYKLVDLMLDLPDADWCPRWKKIYDEAMAAQAKALAELQEKKEAGGAVFTAADYVGAYRDNGYGTITVVEKDGELVIPVGEYACPLLCQEGDKFNLIAEEFGIIFPVTFRRDEAGRVCAADIPMEPEMPDTPIHFARVN